jgi:two-component system cell cycle sensor histidine kinase/response regulator CckA
MANGTSKVMVFPGPKHAHDQHVLQVARKLSATIGAEFFAALAKHLCIELCAEGVYIGQFVSGQMERIQALASYMDGHPENFTYALAGSAAANILLGKRCFFRTGAQKRFPDDELLAKVGSKAFVAVPLSDGSGAPLGFVMALYRNTSANLSLAKTTLEIFAPRASVELVRKQKEEQLRESEQRYKAFIARNADAMWRIEFEQPIRTSLPEEEQLELIYQYGYVAECNDALAKLLQVDNAERLIGTRLDVLIPLSNPSLREATLKAIRSAYRFNIVETTPVDPTGKHRYMLRSQWGIVEDGILRRLWGSSRDITQLRYSERELDASEQRMADLLESVHLAVVMLDPNGAIVSCNNYFHRLTGWKRADVRGQNWLDLMIPAEESARLRAAYAEARAGSQVPLHFECSLRGPDRRRWWIAWDATVLRGADGSPAAIVNVGRDITDQKVLETQFRQAQKLESIGRLASGMAHDFNNLLTIIRGYADLLLQKREKTDPAYTGLTEIRNSCERGAALTKQLLAFSRRQHLKPDVLNLNVLVAECQRMLERLIGADVKLKTNLDPALGMVHADAGQIHQVLMNLAVNARDAMPKGGQLTLTSLNLNVAEGDKSFGLPPGQYVQLAINDTGVGMSEEARAHLFEPFFTTKEQGKGTGLGLSVVYGIVQQSDGQIVFETELNKGTCVRIFLPRVDAEPARSSETDGEVVSVPHGTETILVVDDHESVRAVTAGAIRDLGYRVLEAGSPAGALEIVRQNPGIDALLTDMVMPEMAGPELAAGIREIQPDIKVVFMSGYVDLPKVEQRASDPVMDYLQKPFDSATLAGILRRVLDRK